MGLGSCSAVCYSTKRKMVDEDEKAKRIVKMKVEELQRIVPGGQQWLDHDQLLVHTTGYILFLRSQLHVLETLLKHINSPEYIIS